MREIIGFLFAVCFGTVTVYLVATKQIDIKTTVACLVFAILGGVLIPNHDVIKKIRWRDLEIETFERQVMAVKEEALEEIRIDVKSQKASLTFVTETFVKMAAVLADGAGRFGGIPADHQQKLREYKDSIKSFLSPSLDQEITEVLIDLDQKARQQTKERP